MKDIYASRKTLGADRTKPVNLMDIATIAVKVLKAEGKLGKLDESEEINACTVKIDVDVDGKERKVAAPVQKRNAQPSRLKSSLSAVRQPVSAVLSVIRFQDAHMSTVRCALPVRQIRTRPIEETLEGKLPQRKLVTTAAAGYSSYGNQIGLATGQVDEIYHAGYVAKRMEIGAVIAAAPARECVRRERPVAGDIVILLGGKNRP